MLLSLRPSPRDWLAAGFCAGFSYHAYNGHWFLLPVAACIHLRLHWPAPGRRLAVTRWLTGALIGIGLPLLVGTLCGGASYWRTMRGFSNTVSQGVFAEGWSLPWEYLWNSEGWLGVAVITTLGLAILTKREAGRIPERLWIILGAAAGIYALLVLMSVGAEKFVVYGRTVRPLVPLLCLAGGWALATLLAPHPRWRIVAAGLIVAAAFAHLSPHFTRIFPREAEQLVLREWGVSKHWLSFSGSIYRMLTVPVNRPELVLANAQLIYPVREWIGYPAGTVLLSFDYPLNYRPFQYEGHTPRERRLLREHPLAIRLIKLTEPGQVPDHPPPQVRFVQMDRADGNDHGRR